MTWRLVAALTVTLLVLCDVAPTVGRQFRPADSSTSQTVLRVQASDSVASKASNRRRPQPPSLVGVWGAGSVRSGAVLGKLSEGNFSLVGLRYEYRLIPTTTERPNQPDGATLTYTADAVPFSVVSIPKGTSPGSASPQIRSVKETGLSTRGAGLYPLGLRVGFRPSDAVRPFLAGHTGLFYFSEPMPDERGRQLNFAAGVGAGLRIALTRRTILTLGYRYHHLSNGFRGSINPGLDANLLYLGLGVVP